ncbi:MAG: hypothetical protein AAF989_09475 [Planctomycetota bacterium]
MARTQPRVRSVIRSGRVALWIGRVMFGVLVLLTVLCSLGLVRRGSRPTGHLDMLLDLEDPKWIWAANATEVAVYWLAAFAYGFRSRMTMAVASFLSFSFAGWMVAYNMLTPGFRWRYLIVHQDILFMNTLIMTLLILLFWPRGKRAAKADPDRSHEAD